MVSKKILGRSGKDGAVVYLNKDELEHLRWKVGDAVWVNTEKGGPLKIDKV